MAKATFLGIEIVETEEITYTRVTVKNANPAGFVVKSNGRDIGFIRKFKNTKTDTHPFTALGPLPAVVAPRPLVGHFYPAEFDTARDAMIAAVVAVAQA